MNNVVLGTIKRNATPKIIKLIALVQFYDNVNGYAVLKDCIRNKKYIVEESEFILNPGSSLVKTLYPNRYVEMELLENDEIFKVTNVTDLGGSPLCEFVLNFTSEEQPSVSIDNKINRNTWPRIIAMIEFFDFNEGYGVLNDAVHKKEYYVETDDFVLADNACLVKSIYFQKMVEFDSMSSKSGDKAIFVTDVGLNPIENSVYNSSEITIKQLLNKAEFPSPLAQSNYTWCNQYRGLCNKKTLNSSDENDRASVASDATVKICV